MELEVVETGPVERRLRIQVPTAQVDAAFDVVYREMGRSAHIRGFRPGHAPRQVLERYFGERARHEVLERLVQSTFPKAVEERGLALVSEPRLRPEGEPQVGGPFVYEATVEIRPEIRLERVRGLEIERPRLPEPERDPVEGYLEELRLAHAPLESLPEGAVAARGHVAVIDYDATLDGRPLEGGSGKEQQIEIGAGRALPGFEEQLEGMAPGETREFELPLPDAWPREEQRGSAARFRVVLHELKRKRLPELDDEFARDVSEHDTLDALKASLRERVAQGRAANEQRLLREAALRALVASNPFDVPQSLVERQLATRLARAVSELRGRIADAELAPMIERWRQEWRPDAETDVRTSFLVPEVAKAEGIEVRDEEVEERLRAIAQERGESLTRTMRAYKERGLLEALRAGLLEERVVEFLLSAANLSDA
jgi:trigger factor